MGPQHSRTCKLCRKSIAKNKLKKHMLDAHPMALSCHLCTAFDMSVVEGTHRCNIRHLRPELPAFMLRIQNYTAEELAVAVTLVSQLPET